jgi:hypothetical protein
MVDELRDDAAHEIDRDGKAEAFRRAALPAAAPDDRGIDSDQPPLGVDQRTAAAPDIDGRVSLDEIARGPLR